jgi:type I restriction enzyme, S subunit
MSEWKEYRLGDIADFIDYRGKTPQKTISGVPLITAKIVKNGVIQEPTEFISFEDYPKWMVRGLPKVGDVVLTTEAPLGEVAQIIDASYALAQRIITIRGHENVIHNGFLKYFLKSETGQARLKERETGTTVTGIKSSELKNVIITAPDYPIQLSIASILSSLDDKIELNNAINKNLEALAQALFKQWFVDFEFPNEEGLPYKSSGGAMVESEQGMIPKGWRFGVLDKIAILKKESVKPFSQPDSKYFYFSLPEFDNGKIPSSESGSNILSSKYRVFPYSVLVSKLNPRIPRIWPVINCPKNSVCSTEFQVIKPREDNFFSFIVCLASSMDFTKSLQSKVTGTSSSHQRVNPKDIINHEMVIPKLESMQSFNEVIYPMFRLIEDSREENISLTSLRDTLLPKLISGELEINQALSETERQLL